MHRKNSVDPCQLSPAMQKSAARQLGVPVDRLLKKPKRVKDINICDKEERTADGVVFGSGWECFVYRVLKDLLGREAFEIQREFEIQPSYTRVDGKKLSAVRFTVDFWLWNQVALDTKGHKVTRDAALRIKLAEYKYGVIIHTLFYPTRGENGEKMVRDFVKQHQPK